MSYSTIHKGPRIKRVPAKPKKRTRKILPAVRITKDGRHICNENKAGKAQYKAWMLEMWRRDDYRCCICERTIFGGPEEATFEHTDLRSGGRRDDRPEYTKPNGQVIRNGVAHGICNSQKGSRRI